MAGERAPSNRGELRIGDTAALPVVDSSTTPDVPLALLRIDADPAAARALHAIEGATILGRAATSDIVIDDDATSRAHARILPTRGGLDIEDLERLNGLRVDGHPTTRARLVVGSILRVGTHVFKVVPSTTTPAPSAEANGFVGGTSLDPARRVLELVGPTDLAVFIHGPTGTGKEVVARLLHEKSGRKGPMVTVNCAALPEHLVESELFGHESGAFTGAKHARRGLFEVADGSTLFLDEVGELPLAAQAKFLRVLEDGVVRRVGSDKERRVDVRVLSATHRDLSHQIDAGRFRADLYARLSAVELRLPSLADRVEDLPMLATHLRARAGGPSARFNADALEAMAIYPWPLNVRELDNVLKELALRALGQTSLEDLPTRIRDHFARARAGGFDHVTPVADNVADGTRERATRAAPTTTSSEGPTTVPPTEAEAARIAAALREYGGNVRKASLALGLSRGHVYRLLHRFSIQPYRYRMSPIAGTGLAEASAAKLANIGEGGLEDDQG